MNKNKINTTLKPKIAAAMSGGVDSSVAAKILKDQGYDVTGIFLNFCAKGIKGSEQALSDARLAADKIGIPLRELNLEKIFKKQVINNFLREYSQGRTPNPCVRCNKLAKLGYLIKYAKKTGFDFVASGHYAKIKKTKNACELFKAKDKTRDQSYFLYSLDQDELKHLIFPLGDLKKQKVRKMAKKFKLPAAENPESREICFIAEKDHNEFLKKHLKLKPGKIKTKDGKIMGSHQGLPLFTVGQRKGVEIGGTGPYYAAKMDYKTGVLYVTNYGDDKILYNKKLIAENVHWISGIKPNARLQCRAVIRYGHKPEKCLVSKNGKNNFKVEFLKAQRAIAPGQSVVFYNKDKVLGGGVICKN
ncbi:MAG: tRNA 2-thiouridine(34) synthase MnmA [bacterium]